MKAQARTAQNMQSYDIKNTIITDGLLPYIECRVRDKGHAVCVIAEGSAQSYHADSNGLGATKKHDASGNPLLGDGVLNSLDIAIRFQMPRK